MNLPHYTAFDLLRASTTQPMPLAQRAMHLEILQTSLQHITDADKPDLEAWRLLSDGINHLKSLKELGEIKDTDGAIHDAVGAMANAAAHYQTYGVLRLRDENITRMRHLLEDYSELVNTLPHRTMVRCHMLTEKRTREILRGKRKKGDVVIAI